MSSDNDWAGVRMTPKAAKVPRSWLSWARDRIKRVLPYEYKEVTKRIRKRNGGLGRIKTFHERVYPVFAVKVGKPDFYYGPKGVPTFVVPSDWDGDAYFYLDAPDGEDRSFVMLSKKRIERNEIESYSVLVVRTDGADNEWHKVEGVLVVLSGKQGFGATFADAHRVALYHCMTQLVEGVEVDEE